jgi:inner membrane transporter RhtA
MAASADSARSPTAPAVAMVLGGICSIQIGAALAVDLFDEIGASGAVFLRVLVSAIVLVAIWRPGFRLNREQARLALLFGVVLAGMNLCFYEAIDRIPLGTAVTFEFVGPLGVALITSHRRSDLIWVAIAAAGILLLSGGVGHDGLDPWGIVLALAAGFFWGSYILLGKRVGKQWSGGKGLAIAMIPAAVICAPFGIFSGGADLLEPSALLIGGAVAILSTALPLSLEIEAMRRLPSNVFGVMMSLEPAIAATVGFLLLSQDLAATQILAISLVVAASAGALWTSRAPAELQG